MGENAPASSEPNTPGHGPYLTRLDVEQPRALILMLHGGAQSGEQPVGPRSLSWRRFAALQRAITPRAHAADVSTWLLGYRVRGWNGGSPVRDAVWALQQARFELGDLPIVLLGHSMGGRTAVHVVGDPAAEAVTGVVGLAPWWQRDDPVAGLAGRRVAAAHGSTDKITSAKATRALLQRAEPVAVSTEFVDMGRIGHYMLRRIPAWNDFAVSRALEFLG